MPLSSGRLYRAARLGRVFFCPSSAPRLPEATSPLARCAASLPYEIIVCEATRDRRHTARELMDSRFDRSIPRLEAFPSVPTCCPPRRVSSIARGFVYHHRPCWFRARPRPPRDATAACAGRAQRHRAMRCSRTSISIPPSGSFPVMNVTVRRALISSAKWRLRQLHYRARSQAITLGDAVTRSDTSSTPFSSLPPLDRGNF